MTRPTTDTPYEPPKPLPIQLALQGGGAKICTLMAAIDGVEAMEADKERPIKVTRIAGTSAGSLVACLFAAGIKMEVARTYLLTSEGKRLLKHFPEPSRWKMFRLYQWGTPFWDVKELTAKLELLFERRQIVLLRDLETRGKRIHVKVVAADLSRSQKVVYPDSDKEKRVVEAIVDSCGLPFYMRAWGGRSATVDGGICENLPSDVLRDGDPDLHGRIAALTFPKEQPGLPQDFKSFSLSLLEAAMNNSISRSMESLKETQRFAIPTNIKTFDFQAALDRGLADETYYRDKKDSVIEFLRNFVDDTRRELAAQAAQKAQERAAAIEVKTKQPDVTVDYWGEAGPNGKDVMREMFRVYRAQHIDRKFRYVKCVFEVRANCLLKTGDPYHGTPDSIRYQLTFEPAAEPLYCVSVALARSEGVETGFLGRTALTVRDSASRIVNTINVPALNPDPACKEDRELLIFFNPPLAAGSGRYTLVLQDEAYNFMGLLARRLAGTPADARGEDELSFVPRRALEKVERIDLVLHVPEHLKNGIEQKPKENAAQTGAVMDDSGLAEYTTPLGFHTFGWRGETLEPSAEFGVKYHPAAR